MPGMQAEEGHHHGYSHFADSDVQDRSLSDWDGEWQSVYPYLQEGIFAVTFDETFAQAVGTNANGYNLLIAIVIAVIIVLAMNLVGSLLISALVIFPALSAMRLCKNFRAVTICSAVLSVSCAFVGIVASVLAGTPVGSTIVAVDMAAFGLCCLAGKLLGRAS